MSYFVTCTFDLKGGSSTDYQNAYADLAKIGLSRTVVGDNGGKVVAPTTMAMGEFNGQSAVKVRDNVRDSVKAAFKARKFTSEIFVVVGGDWTCGAGTT
jgi:hypothetical protein